MYAEVPDLALLFQDAPPAPVPVIDIETIEEPAATSDPAPENLPGEDPAPEDPSGEGTKPKPRRLKKAKTVTLGA